MLRDVFSLDVLLQSWQDFVYNNVLIAIFMLSRDFYGPLVID